MINQEYQDFAEWLSGNKALFSGKVGGYTYLFLRIPKRPGIDYLYAQYIMPGEKGPRDRGFDFIGIYNASDGLIYNMKNDFFQPIDDTLDKRSAGNMASSLKKSVRESIETRVGNDRRNLKVQELTGQFYKNRLSDFCQYDASDRAREMYLQGKNPESYEFKCWYTPDNWTEDSLLDYIVDPAGYIQRESDRYWSDLENQEKMLFHFLANDAIAAEYEKLIADTGNQAHTVRRIMEAVNSVDAKTVTVTIRKDGRECTFRTEADVFRRDCTDTYTRREFERRFATYVEYAPVEIVRISYRGKILYEANESVDAQC